jgi:hypothetical protein
VYGNLGFTPGGLDLTANRSVRCADVNMARSIQLLCMSLHTRIQLYNTWQKANG